MNTLNIKLFIIAAIVFFITDMIWLGLIAKSWYLQSYAPWLRGTNGQISPLWWATLLVYLLFGLSVVFFILPLAQGSTMNALLYGAVLGAVIYGIYDFTCLAIFKDFPVGMGLIDWIWGMVLCGWSSMVTASLSHYLK